MKKGIYFSLLIFVFILSGCNMMAGDYKPSDKKEITMDDFKDSDKILKEKIQSLGQKTDTSSPQITQEQQQQAMLEQQASQKEKVTNPITTKKPMSLSKPTMQIDQTKKYTAILKTEAGDMEVSLFASSTPITVNNFVYLAKNKFYDNTIFHRAISGFMIQGGDPTGTGAGSPGYRFDDEKFDGSYSRGTIAMANSGPNTNGSQFFIMHKDYPLPKNYVIFGKVTKGLEVVDAIAEAEVTQSLSGENSSPVKPVVIKSVTIVEK